MNTYIVKLPINYASYELDGFVVNGDREYVLEVIAAYDHHQNEDPSNSVVVLEILDGETECTELLVNNGYYFENEYTLDEEDSLLEEEDY